MLQTITLRDRKPRQARLKPYLSSLLLLPVLMMETLLLPAQGQEWTQEPIQVAQILNTPSPQLSNIQTTTRNFFTLLSQQKFEQATQYVSQSLTAYSSTKQLQQLWQNLLTKTGNFVEIQQIHPSQLSGTYTTLVTIRFENSIEDFVVTLDNNNKITAIDFLRLGNIQTNAEKFADALSQGEYTLARSYLSPDLKKQILPETIKQRWQALLAKTGPFKRRTTSTVISNDSSDVVIINLEFEKYSGRFPVFFDPLGQIIGFDSPLTPQ